jgi:hypothetical protein
MASLNKLEFHVHNLSNPICIASELIEDPRVAITFTTQKQFAWVELFIDDGNTTQLKVESKLTSKIVFHLPQ